MKKIALISSYCDSDEKIQVMLKNIEKIKSLLIEVMVISPFFLPKEVVDRCDYFFVTKDNPVLDWPHRAMYVWKDFSVNEKTFRINKTYADYGFAGLLQVKQLSEIALNLNYDQYFHIIYDLVIDSNVISGLQKNHNATIYPSQRNQQIWNAGLHFMAFDKENLKRFISYIHLDSYLNLKGGDAFVWLEKLKHFFPYNTTEIPVFDEIYFYEDHDFFNYSKNSKLKYYIEKNDEFATNIKIFFYEISQNVSVSILIENQIFRTNVSQFEIIDLGFTKSDIKNVILNVDGEDIDLTQTIINIKHNVINFYE
jgi:hypothetical protein